jgi:hypothetical protein
MSDLRTVLSQPRLLTTTGRMGSYVTLSHHWDQAARMITRVDTYEKNQSVIDFKHLNTLFRDASQLCRALDIRFLWIDSLCIIQNDPKDLNNEIINMAVIYQNRLFNIVALRVPHSQGSFLRPRDSLGIEFHLKDQTWMMRNTLNEWMRDIIPSPLYSRAWYLQEYWLPKQALIFGMDQMY